MEKPKIAFIDDESRILRSLKMHFRQSYDVFTTTDANELMDYLSHNEVQVVVSDQRMPNKSGTEVLRDVREASPNTIRILLTGYADLNAVIDSVNEGEIYRYITKPWQNDELKKVVEKATEIAQQTQAVSHTLTEDTPAATQPLAKRNVLVLDDDEKIFEEIKDNFGSNYSVYWASTLEEASDLLSRKDFGVAIADVSLNGDDIAPAVYALKNIQPDLMVLILTEFRDAHLVIDLINKGQIYRCLPRPTNLSIMGISLERAFTQHELMRQQPVLAARHHVEEAPDVEGFDLSKKIKQFFKRLGWGRQKQQNPT